MVTEEDVRRAAVSLQGVVEWPSWGKPAWFAKTLMARMWEPEILTVKTAERNALGGTDPDIFFWTPHHERAPELVLVRLPLIDQELLVELLLDAYDLAGGRGKHH
ncbi:hypothetical protein PSET11_00749 [Arthrobacter ulcerisalmonis]|uniref:MmcQ/YjbR family DNA-binding protein n=1 Tax=Arthrobacter ulcerisalmonis TaxID=2483813 RepID=A0A3P5WZG1_9MICC|nr:MmcQ/YjbR family DNA-binding protein [Arthrobacter ulcerisalmonis]VDC21387.1 hypothetical protein PSET11_00749 [Arthrobacter ulcerisalmonis]